MYEVVKLLAVSHAELFVNMLHMGASRRMRDGKILFDIRKGAASCKQPEDFDLARRKTALLSQLRQTCFEGFLHKRAFGRQAFRYANDIELLEDEEEEADENDHGQHAEECYFSRIYQLVKGGEVPNEKACKRPCMLSSSAPTEQMDKRPFCSNCYIGKDEKHQTFEQDTSPQSASDGDHACEGGVPIIRILYPATNNGRQKR